MIKFIEVKIDLPFEENKTYQTKFQTGEHFTIKKLIFKKDVVISVVGIYEKAPHLENCPLSVDRLIPETEIKLHGVEVCNCCGRVMNEI